MIGFVFGLACGANLFAAIDLLLKRDHEFSVVFFLLAFVSVVFFISGGS